jgi:hypothetical protein
MGSSRKLSIGPVAIGNWGDPVEKWNPVEIKRIRNERDPVANEGLLVQ